MATGRSVRKSSVRTVGRSRGNVRRAKRAALIVGAVKARKAAKTSRRRRAAVAVAAIEMKKAKPMRKARARAR